MIKKPLPPVLKLKPASVIRREAQNFLSWRRTKAKEPKARQYA